MPVQDSAGPVITVNTNNLANGGIIYRGSPNQNALDLSASDIQGTLAVTDGGTGLSTTPTDGQLLIGDGTDDDYNLATLTAGNGVTITNGRSSITIDADGAPDPDAPMGHWDRDNASTTLSPRIANDSLDMGSGNITTTGTGVFDDVYSDTYQFNNDLIVQTTDNNGDITLHNSRFR